MGSKEYEQHKPEFCCEVDCLMGKLDARVTLKKWFLSKPSGLKRVATTMKGKQ